MNWKQIPAAILIAAFSFFAARLVSHRGRGNTALAAAQATSVSFEVSSSAFSNGDEIPKKFTCDGEDKSPPLAWSHPPAGTKTYALIADDPDAPGGTWTHWVVLDLPATTASLPEGMPKSDELPGGEKQGVNDFGKIGYGGPCPPPGKPHRYFFKLFALDHNLALKPGASHQDVEQAMKGHVIGQSQWMGTYRR